MAILRSSVGRRVGGIGESEWAMSPAQRVKCETNKGLLSLAREDLSAGELGRNTARNTKPQHLASLTSTSGKRARCTGSAPCKDPPVTARYPHISQT
jgi:hypothetical protein